MTADPGSGIWLVPIGALLMLYGVAGFACGFPRRIGENIPRKKKTMIRPALHSRR